MRRLIKQVIHTMGRGGSPNLLYNEYRVSFPGIKRPGRGVDHPPRTIAEVQETVVLPLWAVMVCFTVNFTFNSHYCYWTLP
jgi:hypothetical protein